jgi:hypothetical protein
MKVTPTYFDVVESVTAKVVAEKQDLKIKLLKLGRIDKRNIAKMQVGNLSTDMYFCCDPS